MEGWYYTLIFFFSILVVTKNIVSFIMKLTANTPKEYEIGKNEFILLGITISYILTYLIY